MVLLQRMQLLLDCIANQFHPLCAGCWFLVIKNHQSPYVSEEWFKVIVVNAHNASRLVEVAHYLLYFDSTAILARVVFIVHNYIVYHKDLLLIAKVLFQKQGDIFTQESPYESHTDASFVFVK